MTDENIKELFAGFRPEIGSENDFISRLQASLSVIEDIKKEQASLRRCCRIAAAIASLAGFLTGLLLALFLPDIAAFIGGLEWPSVHLPQCDFTSVAWLITACASITVALTSYEAAYRLLRPRGLTI